LAIQFIYINLCALPLNPSLPSIFILDSPLSIPRITESVQCTLIVHMGGARGMPLYAQAYHYNLVQKFFLLGPSSQG
jgi:hypothetical protein